MMKLAILSGLVLSVSCTLLHQPLPYFELQYVTPNYNFAYEVNDVNTGDIKNQHESRRGDTVVGQYSLIQPDGIRRVVDYTADELAGFRATVNNEGRTQQRAEEPQRNTPNNYAVPTTTQTPTPAPAVAISRSSFVQTFSHGNQNPWI